MCHIGTSPQFTSSLAPFRPIRAEFGPFQTPENIYSKIDRTIQKNTTMFSKQNHPSNQSNCANGIEVEKWLIEFGVLSLNTNKQKYYGASQSIRQGVQKEIKKIYVGAYDFDRVTLTHFVTQRQRF